jgi:hypothetical protein
MALGLLFGLLFLAAYVLQFTGTLFCLAAPKESGSKGLIIGSVICMIVSLLVGVLGYFEIRATAFDPYLSSGVSVLGTILFMLFLWKLARYIGRPDLARRALIVLLAAIGIGLFVSGSFAMNLGAIHPNLAGEASGWLLIGSLVAALVVFVLYANLVNAMRKALRP